MDSFYVSPLHRLTGIRDVKAARRYLSRKFRESPATAPVARPGARFYVTTRSAGTTALLLGPYASHMSALDNVKRARRMLGDSVFAAVGTSSLPVSRATRFGR